MTLSALLFAQAPDLPKVAPKHAARHAALKAKVNALNTAFGEGMTKGKEATAKGRYMQVLRKDKDGKLRIFRDCPLPD